MAGSDRSGTDGLVSRRRFLGQCAGFAAAGSVAGLLGCAEDLAPGDPWTLWVAKSLRGAVFSAVSSKPIPFARARFWCGLKPNEFALFGDKYTDGAGRYVMEASEHPSGQAGYWRFIVDASFFRSSGDDVPVYCLIEVSKPGFDTERRELTLYRRPQKKLPPESEAFHMVQNMQLR